jgi:hypothetical protein
MPFIKEQIVVPTTDLKVKIEEPVNELLDSYCEFLKSPKGYVVQELLRKAIVKDRDFQTSRGNVKNVKTRKPRGRKRLLDDERKSESEIEAVA